MTTQSRLRITPIRLGRVLTAAVLCTVARALPVTCQRSERDRDAIVDYLLEKIQSRLAAERFLDELDRLIGVLEELPESFPRAQDRSLAALDLRKAPCMNYLVLYRAEGDTVYLMRIFHQSQDYVRFV